MQYKDYVQNVVKSYLNYLNKKAIFIKHYNSLSITLDEMIDNVDCSGAYSFLFHEFEPNEMKEAYEPFLSWVKVCYYSFYSYQCTPEEFVERCEIYSLHREIICGYIRDGKCHRSQEILPEEYEFESNCMKNSLYNIFKYVSKEHSLVMIISKLHLAPYATLDLLNYMFDREDDIHFIFTYNDIFFIRDLQKNLWNSIIEKAEYGNMIFEWGKIDSQQSTEFEDAFIYDAEKQQEYIDKMINMYLMFGFKDAEYYNSILFDIILRDEEEVSDTDCLKLLALYAYVNVGLKNYNMALFICEKMMPIIQRNDNKYFEYLYNYILATVYFLTVEPELTYKYCDRCRRLALEMNSDKLIFQTEVLECSAHFVSFKDVFQCNFSYQIDYGLVDKTKKYGFELFLAYLYIFGYDNDAQSLREIAEGRKEPEKFNQGIEIASRLGNTDLVLLAYMKNIVCFSEMGYYSYVDKLYKTRMKLLDKSDEISFARMCSGMGYNYTVLEKYKEADRYYRDGLALYINQRNSEGIAESLYNISINYYVAGINDKCVECLEYLFKIINTLGLNGIQMCNTSKIYGIIGLAHYKMGQYYNCYYYLDKIENFMGHILKIEDELDNPYWNEDLFLYHMLKGVMYSYENDYIKSSKELDKSRIRLDRIKGTDFYMHADYIMLRAATYRRAEKYRDAERLLSEGMDYCLEKGYLYKANQIKVCMDGMMEFPKDEINVAPLPYDEIINIANYEGEKVKLANKEKDINFLTMCQDILVSENNSVESVTDSCINIIKNTYDIDQILILDREDNRVVYCCADREVTENDVEDIFTFFDSYKKEFISRRTGKSFGKYYPIIDKFGRDDILAIIGIPIVRGNQVVKAFVAAVDLNKNKTISRTNMEESTLRILKVVVEQLDVAINRINNGRMILSMNATLEKAAITDQLTGLYNRAGFNQITEESDVNTGVLMYMDLDNFKFHNDKFGHHMGDDILKEFAEIISAIIGENGYAIRYGGDEFVIMIPGEKEEYATDIADIILSEIDSRLRGSIQRALGEGVIIDKDKEITCSIGIAEYSGLDSEQMEEALKRADKALYYVKDNNKGQCISWSQLELERRN